MVVFVVRSTRGQNWRNAVCKAKIGRYAVRKRGGGVTLIKNKTYVLK